MANDTTTLISGFRKGHWVFSKEKKFEVCCLTFHTIYPSAMPGTESILTK